MRIGNLAFLLSTAALMLAGCNAAGKESSSGKEASAREASAAAAVSRTPVAEAPAAAEAPAVADEAGEKVPAEAAVEEAEEPTKLSLFRDGLKEAGFVEVGVLPLLPDLLGGLDECEALSRDKVEFESEHWTTLGIFETSEKASACLRAYLKTPGAEKIKDSYVHKGVYLLEVRPSMSAIEKSRIKGIFAKVAVD